MLTKFYLIFENTNDSIPFKVIYNHDLIEFFIKQSESRQFFNNNRLSDTIDKRLTEINWAVSKTNEICWKLSGEKFIQNDNLLDYLDQQFLNRQHESWVLSQYKIIDIDELRFSEDAALSQIGNQLHDLYPDEIRKIRLAEAMIKLGYIFPYEEVNMTVHRLESIFSLSHEYSAIDKWQTFSNPYIDTMVSNLDKVNFSFGYTYVGRQYYNKWQFWDTNLECSDHYNYEQLEWSFQMNLNRPETIEWSPEFKSWAQEKNVKLIAPQLPVANIIDLEKNLTYYRKVLYENSRQNNPAKLIID